MKKTFLILLLLLTILLSTSINAIGEYTKKGGIAGSFTSVYSGSYESVTLTDYTRNGDYSQYSVPLIYDINDDGTNDIVVINNNTLEVLKYTSGLGVSIQASISMGEIDTIKQTPYIPNWGGVFKIVANNVTHFLVYNFNGTGL